ncbi:MAG TPA: SpoIIE family protein phosphatase [Streptosporangiaceae bacterium]|nr:SpoIIE family protein phosphatase [Streptosporangiaceae bacterium]
MVSVTGPWRGAGRGERELLLSLPAAVAYVSGPDLVYEFANEEYQQLVGGRDLIGRPLREALPELAPERLEAVLRVARTGEPFQDRESELWLRRHGRAPEQLFVELAYQPVRDDAGRIDGVLLYGSDVTGHVRDRRRLEALAGELASSEERYRTLFETLPQGVVHYTADGSMLGANPAAREILGLAPDAMTAGPLDPEELPVMAALRTGEIVADVVLGVPHGRTGELRWLRVTAVPDARDEQGRPHRAYAMFTDITEQRRAETALRESGRLLGSLQQANVLGVVVAGEEGIEEANDAFLDIVGYTRQDLESGRLTWAVITPPEWAQVDADVVEQLLRTGACPPYEKEHLHRDGHRVPTLVGAVLLDRYPMRWAKFVVDLTARQRAEQDRAELLAREQAARAEAGAAQERLTLLLRAGSLVAATRDRDDLLQRATQLVVPALADYCVAVMPTADGKLLPSALTHRDPASAELLERLREHPIPADGRLKSQLAYTTGSTQLASAFSLRAPAWAGAAPELMEIVDQLRPTSALAVPLLAGQRALGVLMLGRGEDRARFAETDVVVMEELARRLAAGLANAETFAREHTVAQTLQRALLPDAPAPVEGLDLAVRYVPASDGVHVGGDWYDAFPLGRHRVGLAIGDVAGHGIGSASIMGQVRSLLHGYAIDNPAPPDVLRRINTAIGQMLPDALATVWYAVLDLATGDLAYANAGHLPPLISSGPGHAEYLDAAPAIMLGATPGTTFTATHRRLPPGARLLLYTDGLVEDRRRDISEGLDALIAAFRRSPGRTAEQICQSVQTSLLGSAPRADDVCILAVGLPPRLPAQPGS